MAYEHPLKAKPTATNLLAAQELSRPVVTAMMTEISIASKPLLDVVQTSGAVSPTTLVAAVVAWIKAGPRIAAAAIAVLGVAVLGGEAVTTTARLIGMRPATLGERLRTTWAGARGSELIRDGDTWAVK
ncbi:MAG: hypothetical protein WBO08_18640 [Mycobacterium sp.]